MATHYFTAEHADPLVVLPRMGLFFMKPKVCFLTPFSRGLKRMLDHFIAAGGDFRVEMPDSGLVVLRIQCAELDFSCSLNGCDVFIESLACVQRRVRRKQGRLRLVAEFQRSDRGASLPIDVVKKITHACFEARSAICHEAKVVYTNSFKERT